MIVDHLVVRNVQLVFDLHFKANLTLLNGDSGVGKTFLYNSIVDACLGDPTLPIVYLNRVNANAQNIESIIKSTTGKLIVIDNADILLSPNLREYVSLDERNQYFIFAHLSKGYLPVAYSYADLLIKK
jgi:DNA repair ATPase RecN